MSFSLVYLFGRAFFRVTDFFHHWYIDASRRAWHYFLEFLAYLDRAFAVKITLRHFGEPLYGDYSFVGRILGIIFRSARVFIGGVVYLIVMVIFLAICLVWLAVPVSIISYAWYF